MFSPDDTVTLRPVQKVRAAMASEIIRHLTNDESDMLDTELMDYLLTWAVFGEGEPTNA